VAEQKKKRKSRSVEANLLATLVYYDEPHVLLLSSSADVRYIAVAVPDDNFENKFFASKINISEWDKYNTGYTDLRYLFTSVSRRRWYIFDLMDMNDGKIKLSPVEDESGIPEDYLPSHGFFSRDHTADYDAVLVATPLRVLAIDGNWKLNDFSKLYARTEDVYSFFIALRNFTNANFRLDFRRAIKEAFQNYPWRGGSSYVHFFDDLFRVQPDEDKVGVRSIQYASPGEIKLKGNPQILDIVRDSASNFARNKDDIQKSYAKLYKYLKTMKLLKVDGDRFDNQSPMATHILGLAKTLATELRVDEFDMIHELTNKNALATAKIILAFERRVRDLDNFVSEGRLSFW
jgi:hypothetical protein